MQWARLGLRRHHVIGQLFDRFRRDADRRRDSFAQTHPGRSKLTARARRRPIGANALYGRRRLKLEIEETRGQAACSAAYFAATKLRRSK